MTHDFGASSRRRIARTLPRWHTLVLILLMAIVLVASIASTRRKSIDISSGEIVLSYRVLGVECSTRRSGTNVSEEMYRLGIAVHGQQSVIEEVPLLGLRVIRESRGKSIMTAYYHLLNYMDAKRIPEQERIGLWNAAVERASRGDDMAAWVESIADR